MGCIGLIEKLFLSPIIYAIILSGGQTSAAANIHLNTLLPVIFAVFAPVRRAGTEKYSVQPGER